MEKDLNHSIEIGQDMIGLMKDLWPINRSISGQGLRKTLNIFKSYLKELEIHEVESGSKVLDWIVPEEWEINEAYIKDQDEKIIVNFEDNNLHVIGYSSSVNKKLSLKELISHLYSLPDQPDAIPYVTSYYQKNWGFCVSENFKKSLKEGTYQVFIDSKHFHGSISYGDLIIKGKKNEEILISTYCCHPSMANNELSGPCLAVALAMWLQKQEKLTYTYRFVFIPEMIGSAAVLEKHRKHLKEKVVSAFNLTCVGDNRTWSFLPSRKGNSYADQIALHCLKHYVIDFDKYTWQNRGSDESMYCAPFIDLPMVSVMRSKYETYPEYHTSLDKIGSVVTAEGMEASLNMHKRMIEILENDCLPTALVLGEPQLGRRNLYPMISTKGSSKSVRMRLDLISYADGTMSLLEIADLCNLPFEEILDEFNVLQAHKVLDSKPVSYE